MEKVLFIISSEHYSNDLLSRCLEKYSGATCYHFFSKEEMMLYLDLNPSLIICEGEDFSLTKEEIAKMREKMEMLPSVYAVFSSRIELFKIKNNGLKSVKKLNYDNLFSSLSSLVNYAEGTRKASPMLMY